MVRPKPGPRAAAWADCLTWHLDVRLVAHETPLAVCAEAAHELNRILGACFKTLCKRARLRVVNFELMHQSDPEPCHPRAATSLQQMFKQRRPRKAGRAHSSAYEQTRSQSATCSDVPCPCSCPMLQRPRTRSRSSRFERLEQGRPFFPAVHFSTLCSKTCRFFASGCTPFRAGLGKVAGSFQKSRQEATGC